MHATARIVRFAVEDLRERHPAAPGTDPRLDAAPFRAFRAALLEAAAHAAVAPATLSMWWEGTFNGYALALAIAPDGAVAPAALQAACPVEGDRAGEPPAEARPLGTVEPGRAEVARDGDGAAWEAPFGGGGGHFGVPGMRRAT